jgi:hypothetical protein
VKLVEVVDNVFVQIVCQLNKFVLASMMTTWLLAPVMVKLKLLVCILAP